MENNDTTYKESPGQSVCQQPREDTSDKR